MGLVTREPTANQSQDVTLGGSPVTGLTLTGHASTVTTSSGGASDRKSARWFTFQVVSGQKKSITLKIDHTSSGSLIGPSPTNQFTLEYSLNNGGSWITAVSRTNFTSSAGPTTFSVALSLLQDITQIQVRVLYDVNTIDIGDTATVTATIANIKLEVVTGSSNMIIMT